MYTYVSVYGNMLVCVQWLEIPERTFDLPELEL